jgi:hypothetical protein
MTGDRRANSANRMLPVMAISAPAIARGASIAAMRRGCPRFSSLAFGGAASVGTGGGRAGRGGRLNGMLPGSRWRSMPVGTSSGSGPSRRSTTAPTRMVSPTSTTTGRRTGWPSTQVPLEESASSIWIVAVHVQQGVAFGDGGGVDPQVAGVRAAEHQRALSQWQAVAAASPRDDCQPGRRSRPGASAGPCMLAGVTIAPSGMGASARPSPRSTKRPSTSMPSASTPRAASRSPTTASGARRSTTTSRASSPTRTTICTRGMLQDHVRCARRDPGVLIRVAHGWRPRATFPRERGHAAAMAGGGW